MARWSLFLLGLTCSPQRPQFPQAHYYELVCRRRRTPPPWTLTAAGSDSALNTCLACPYASFDARNRAVVPPAPAAALHRAAVSAPLRPGRAQDLGGALLHLV